MLRHELHVQTHWFAADGAAAPLSRRNRRGFAHPTSIATSASRPGATAFVRKIGVLKRKFMWHGLWAILSRSGHQGRGAEAGADILRMLDDWMACRIDLDAMIEAYQLMRVKYGLNRVSSR